MKDNDFQGAEPDGIDVRLLR